MTDFPSEDFETLKIKDTLFINNGYEYYFNWSIFSGQPLLFKVYYYYYYYCID